MKIAIIGTRGIPNNYGGYEQITEVLAAGFVQKGHEVTVYNSHNHPNQSKAWKGITIQHCYDPEFAIGTAGQFIYDLNCIRHARKNNFDAWLFMGYTSSSVWQLLYPKDATIISNMDGMEWKRTKYSKPVQQFLKFAEKLAVRNSHFHIADSLAIKAYLDEKYMIDAQFIPYGAMIRMDIGDQALVSYNLRKEEYSLLMARMEPENNVEMILDGLHSCNSDKQFLVIGKTENKFGNYLVKKYKPDQRIKFLGPIYDQGVVNQLRANSHLYFHGHSVGGTNPSLLEAMASGALIAAHENVFNRSVLNNDAFYFSSPDAVKNILEKEICIKTRKEIVNRGLEKINKHFNWQAVIDSYDEFICRCYTSMRNEKHSYHKGFAFK